MCPWCGDEVDDTPEEIIFNASEVCETDCGGCGQPVTIKRYVWMNYVVERRAIAPEEKV
jgi:hypothetical protein